MRWSWTRAANFFKKANLQVLKEADPCEAKDCGAASSVSKLSAGEPVNISWGPVLKSYRTQPNHRPLILSEAQIFSEAEASNDSTWLWSIIGVATLRKNGAGYSLRAEGSKTQMGAYGEGFNPPNTDKVGERKKGHLDAWAAGRPVAAKHNPVGGGSFYTMRHEWRYGNENSVAPPITSDEASTTLANLDNFHWNETKGKSGWSWEWEAEWTPPKNDGGTSEGAYLLVLDQRALRLKERPKRYMTELMGRMVKIPDVGVHTNPARIEDAARAPYEVAQDGQQSERRRQLVPATTP